MGNVSGFDMTRAPESAEELVGLAYRAFTEGECMACGEFDFDGTSIAIRNTRPSGSTYVFDIEGEVDAYSIDL